MQARDGTYCIDVQLGDGQQCEDFYTNDQGTIHLCAPSEDAARSCTPMTPSFFCSPPPLAPPPSPLVPVDPWFLILRQVTPSVFDATVKSTFRQNEDSPEADVFTNIGALNWTQPRYLDGSGKHYFKAIWISDDGNQQSTVEWKQSNSPLSSTLSGYEPIQVFDASRTGCEKLLGIGKSADPRCMVDGNGGNPCWWNCL